MISLETIAERQGNSDRLPLLDPWGYFPLPPHSHILAKEEAARAARYAARQAANTPWPARPVTGRDVFRPGQIDALRRARPATGKGG